MYINIVVEKHTAWSNPEVPPIDGPHAMWKGLTSFKAMRNFNCCFEFACSALNAQVYFS